MRLGKGWVVGTVLFLAAAIPGAAAPPFGVFEGLGPNRNAGTGILPLTGWALDDDGIQRVDIFVDGVIAGRADLRQNRPDVGLLFPGFPDSGRAGFGILLDSTRYLNDLHSITARVTSNTGEQIWLGPKMIQFTNVTHLLVPFGAITFPNPHAELSGKCNLNDPFRRFSVIEGWALDQGVEIGDSGVKYVELLINGAIYANSHTDCFFSPVTGGYTNCYGLPSLDVEAQFPTVPHSPRARFRFVLDVGMLIEEFDFSIGLHWLTIRSGDVIGQVANIAEIPVFFSCAEFIGNQASFGFIDQPVQGQLVSGNFLVTGWALDGEGVTSVRVFLDGDLQGTATYGQPRPDVLARYPGYPNSAAAGWSFLLNTRVVEDGIHHIQVEVTDGAGVVTLIGEQYLTIRNEVP